MKLWAVPRLESEPTITAASACNRREESLKMLSCWVLNEPTDRAAMIVNLEVNAQSNLDSCHGVPLPAPTFNSSFQSG